MSFRVRRWALVVCALCAVSIWGCFRPEERDGAVACGPSGSCPSGFACAWDGLCYRTPPDPPDGPTADGALFDGPDPDAPATDGPSADASVDGPACLSRDTDPACSGGAVYLGEVAGDTGNDMLMTTGYAEAWFASNVLDSSGSNMAMTARIELQNPPDVNMDLFVTCEACGDSRTLSSTNGPGLTDTVLIGRDDGGGDRSYGLLVEVRWVSSTVCDDWTLTVSGNVSTNNRTCN